MIHDFLYTFLEALKLFLTVGAPTVLAMGLTAGVLLFFFKGLIWVYCKLTGGHEESP